MGRALDAVYSIEPAYVKPEHWRQFSEEENWPLLKKHIFRWYIEEGRTIGQLAIDMGEDIQDLKPLLESLEIKEKGIYVPDERPHRLRLYFEKAELTATRTTCLKDGTGAVLINARRRDILYSFNGPSAGDLHCTDVGTCKKDVYGYGPGEGYETCVAVHAEQNVICEAAAAGISTENQVMLITRKPCPICYRLIRMARIKMVIYPDPETDELMGLEFSTLETFTEEELEEIF